MVAAVVRAAAASVPPHHRHAGCFRWCRCCACSRCIARPVRRGALLLPIADRSGRRHGGRDEEPTPAENIEALISAGTEEGLIEEEDRKLIQSVVEFGDKVVREVMTPRPNIVAISADSTLEQLARSWSSTSSTRAFPVYEQNIDQIIGFVHVRDMFEIDERRAREPHRPRTGPPDAVRARDQAGQRPDAPDAAGEHPHGHRRGRVRQHRRPRHHGRPARSHHRRDPRRARAG